MDSLPWNWLFWILIVAFAIRMLLTQVELVRNRLRELLVDHFERETNDVKRRRAIARVQEKVRKLKEMELQEAKKIMKAASAAQTTKKSA